MTLIDAPGVVMKQYSQREPGKFRLRVIVEYDGRKLVEHKTAPFPYAGARWTIPTDNELLSVFLAEGTRAGVAAIYESLHKLGWVKNDIN